MGASGAMGPQPSPNRAATGAPDARGMHTKRYLPGDRSGPSPCSADAVGTSSPRPTGCSPSCGSRADGRVSAPDGAPRLTTRHDLVAAADELAPDGHRARLVDHGDFVVALLPGQVAVFEFAGLDIARRWTIPPSARRRAPVQGAVTRSTWQPQRGSNPCLHLESGWTSKFSRSREFVHL